LLLPSTGLPDRIDGKPHRLFHFGASADDHKALDAAKRKWVRNATLPSRFVDENGLGGMHKSFFINNEPSMETMESQWWANSNGRNVIRHRQSLDTLNEDSAAVHMPEKRSREASLIVGPHYSPTHLKLMPGRGIPLKDIWKREAGEADPRDLMSNHKRGFIFNLGAKVQCLDWSPNQDGAYQYLAASCLPQRQAPYEPFESPHAPAFHPRPSHTSSFQIWRFHMTSDGGMDLDVLPHLDAVLCTEWGDAKMLKWCPTSYQSHMQSDEDHPGVLAGVWSDGTLRILDVDLSQDMDETRYLRVERAAFKARPPDTICTCLTWVSSTRIAAGCANGCIAVWDLDLAWQPSSSNPRPSIYSNVSATYILSIATCHPSHPHLLLTGSMSGFTSVTDLSRFGQSLTSQANTVFGSRARMGLPLLIWHDFGQIAIQAEDNTTVKGSTLRRFFAGIALAKGKSNATSIANSPCHPSILIGCANGDVFATNPLNKVVDAGRSETWQQMWFTHEWRRPSVEQLTSGQIDLSAEKIAHEPNGISRLTEGFKAELQSLGDGRSGQKHNRHFGTAFTTVYEEQSAITALAWNPNPHVGGWAAAGMGDGLLRVEDISI
jgi:transcription factor C subunit 6